MLLHPTALRVASPVPRPHIRAVGSTDDDTGADILAGLTTIESPALAAVCNK